MAVRSRKKKPGPSTPKARTSKAKAAAAEASPPSTPTPSPFATSITPPSDPVLTYAEDVIAGRVVAGRLVRLACERHLRDLVEGAARGLRWDLSAALHAIEFFKYLHLAEGEHAGKVFEPQPFQKFIVGSLFGWKGPDGFRRFRTAYVEQAKGNGKSPTAAGIGLYGLIADGEAGAEIYSAATTRPQASILFRDAQNMVSASPELKGIIDVSQFNLAHVLSNSFFRPVSSEHRGLDGKRVHMALIDEVHEHPTPLVVDKMRAGTKGRRQAMIFEITNSGYDRDSVCYQHHAYSVELLTGKAENGAWFAFVCGLDACEKHSAEGKTQPVDGCAACDDWHDEKVWPKANPNLGVSVTLKYLREQVEEAKGMPAKEGIVKRLNFCIWTESETSWLSTEVWSRGAGPIDRPSLAAQVCFGGLDLASRKDLAAFVLCFPDVPEPGHYSLLCRAWIPRAQAEFHARESGIPYLLWERQGFVTLTEGDTIHHDRIEEAIKADSELYDLQDIAVDPWNAAQITEHLHDHGIKVVEFAQNIRNFNEPCKWFEGLLIEGKLHHGDNPLLNWCAGNVAVWTDASANIRPVKPEHGSAKKIDPIVAGVMAGARAMLWTGRVYDSKGLELL